MRLLRRLAYGYYQLPSAWQRDGDRRFQISAVLSTMFVCNLIAVRNLIEELDWIRNGTYQTDLPKWLIVLLTLLTLYVMHNYVVTGQVYLEIKNRPMTDPARAGARLLFLIYAALTVALIIGVLVLIGIT